MKPTNKAPPSSARAIESCRRTPVVAAAELHARLQPPLSLLPRAVAPSAPPPHLVMPPHRLAPRTACQDAAISASWSATSMRG